MAWLESSRDRMLRARGSIPPHSPGSEIRCGGTRFGGGLAQLMGLPGPCRQIARTTWAALDAPAPGLRANPNHVSCPGADRSAGLALRTGSGQSRATVRKNHDQPAFIPPFRSSASPQTDERQMEGFVQIRLPGPVSIYLQGALLSGGKVPSDRLLKRVTSY